MELPVRVTLLGEKPVIFDSAMVTEEQREISLRSVGPLALRAPVKIESADRLWMGEVMEVRRDGAAYIIEVRVEHTLSDLADLMRLAERFAGKSEPAEEKTSARAVP